jgi:hypothetical protein
MDGSEQLDALIISRTWKPRCFKGKLGKDYGFVYHANQKAWMTAAIFNGWLMEWDKRLSREHRKILLLVDNFSGHARPPILNNILVEYFAPNMTSHIQPLDQGIIRAFKAIYCRIYLQHVMDRVSVRSPREPITVLWRPGSQVASTALGDGHRKETGHQRQD